MIKVLHCADIHLDSPFRLSDIEKAQVLRAELRGSFSSLTAYIKMNSVDLVLICGDMFDSEYVTNDTLAYVKREFELCKNTKFVIAPGNHDPYTPGGIWYNADFSDNVYIFPSEKLSFFSFDDLGVDVYGFAFTSDKMKNCPINDIDFMRKDRINIFCGHCDMTSSDSLTAPISQNDIINSGYDYIALGHIHSSEGIKHIDNKYYGYSGCLCGRDFGECGHKGAVCVEMDKDTNGIFKAEIHGKRFSNRRFEILNLNLTGVSDYDALISSIGDAIKEEHFSDDTALRVILGGDISPDITISERKLSQMFSDKLFFLEFIDKTSPTFDSEKLKNDKTIRGKFFNALLPLLTSDNEEERRNAETALKFGLVALSENDITDI